MHIGIIGGGIAGLTTALSLHRAGIKCTVFESVSELRELGVGINLLPHAVARLQGLGLGDELAATAIETAELRYFNRHGQGIWQESRGVGAGYPCPQYSIHRGRLLGLLQRAAREALGSDALKLGHHFDGFRTLADGRIALTFLDGRGGAPRGEYEVDAVIAADGIHSRMRALHYPDEGMPVWNGAILWRGVTESPAFLTGRSMFMAGHQDQKFVAYPIGPDEHAAGHSLTNWIAELRFPAGELPAREDWNTSGDFSKFLPQFENWRFDWLDIPALIRGADQCFEFPMVDRDPVPTWVWGRIALLGDAAHPMYPIGSNGASQAILDADCMTQVLTEHPTVEEAFAAYDAERRPKVSAIVLANRKNGPEQVMQLAEERAPEGFAHVNDVIEQSELQAIADRYKQLAGFDRRSVDASVANAEAP